MAVADGDLDGDGLYSTFAYVHPVSGAPAMSYVGPPCAPGGAYNPATGTNDFINPVGACDPLSRQSEL